MSKHDSSFVYYSQIEFRVIESKISILYKLDFKLYVQTVRSLDNLNSTV